MLTVHLRINDAATGQPTPVRLRVSAEDGTQFAPLGRAAEFPAGRNEDVGGHLRLGPERWYYTDGACEMALPAGVPLRVQAAKGPAYVPLDRTVTLGAGQISLRFAVERRADSRADGWLSIDTRCHFVAPHTALLEAAAEGLDVVNLLATPFQVLALDANTYTTTPNLLAFSGQSPALEAGGRVVGVNTLNTHPVLGKVALLHSHRPVFPLTFGGPDETDDWSVCDWCDQCRRKGGLAVWVDAFEPAGGLAGGEALVAAILGKIDAVEVGPAPRKVPLLPRVYQLWDAGILVPLVGASGKDSNKIPLGSMRTYAQAGADSWVEAVRAGRTFVTGGPLLDVRHDGPRFHAAVRAEPADARVEIVTGGRVVASGSTVEAVAAEPGWVAARAHAGGGFAHTSPVVVSSPPRKPEAVVALRALVEQTRAWVEERGRFANPKRKQALLGHCAAALAKLGEPA